MENNFVSDTMLFHNLKKEEINSLLVCCGAYRKTFGKDETIYHAGEKIDCMGLVISGSVNVTINYYWGGSNIFGHFCAGDIFAETYAAIPDRELPVNVVAAENCEVLFIPLKKLLSVCPSACAFHTLVVQNLLQIFACKNLNLSARMMHTASRSIRSRLLSYFSELAAEHGGNCFDIPFTRQELADYLGVERSALSNAISKMQKEGLLKYRKNHFELNSKILNEN